MIHAETLELLEWPRLCQQLATFAATKLGQTAAQHLQIPTYLGETLELLGQTREAYQLEQSPTAGLNFGGVKDIGEALERSELQGILGGHELLAIATTLAGARQLRRVIDSQSDLTRLQSLTADLRTYPELEQAIHHCIDDRAQVTDRASLKLEGIRQQLKTIRDQIYEKLQRILQRQASAVQEHLITQRGDRFVLPVKAPQKDAIPGIVHDTSTSGVTLYIEPHAIVELGNRLRQRKRQEQAEEEIVRRTLTEKVAEVKLDLERLLIIVTSLDLAVARARYSLWLEANPPRLIEWGKEERRQKAGEESTGVEAIPEIARDEQTHPPPSTLHPPPSTLHPANPKSKIQNPKSKIPSPDPITLRQLRHPLLIWQTKHEQGPDVVPIDIIIQPQIRVVAITGPNTGGKTVTLKTLGLAALMAKVGLFIPAREPVELPWFDQILADIGDEQSIEQSLSTFSGHIRRIGRILAALPPPLPPSPPPLSLVLLDEVGAGTDPSEGSALAIALLQHLADQAQLTIATTHFGELKALKYQDQRFENASVEFDNVSLSPTYRLLWGIPGRSNALTIARRLGLKPEIVDQAQTYVGMGTRADVNQVIAGLEAQRRRQENKAQQAEQLVAQTEQLHQEVARKAQFLKQREQALQQHQEQAVQAAIAQAKAEIAQVIRRLQQGPATAQEAQKATEAINQISEHQIPSRRRVAKPKPGFTPQIGDRIRISSLGQTAEVLTAPDENGKFTVRFGLMKMAVGLTDIESLTGEKAEPPAKPSPQSPIPRTSSAPAPAVRTGQNTIDIRGKRVVEAESVLEDAIAKASGPIWIIHGHGTGKLRRGVHEFLDRHPQVQRYEAAEQADGGTGVTVAYI
ncbi:MAG: endonuclease MutS2 [Pseudanabaenales cyanobacterium]|nr:endonuclease MutS2 [Pseudanabaenales cyanobacterium]